MKDIYNKSIVNYNQFIIDNLPLRKKVHSKKIYYNSNCTKHCKSMHICLDSYDKSKSLRTMAMHDLPQKETTCYYYLDIKNNRVVKLKEYHDKIIYNQVYHGTKSQAQKKLDRLVK